jgi:hypothetical protein
VFREKKNEQMKISGFTFSRNAGKLYYPIKASIQSILPLVDEFIVALGDNDPDDTTRQEIENIGSPKIRIIDTVWDIDKYPRGMEYAHQTDIAKSYCTGDWLFYLQSDEVIHEKYLPVIKERCTELLTRKEVEGLLFRYVHFWGDYCHYHDSHGWYRKEIRIIRNDPDIHSFQDAQSFRRIPDFDGLSYRTWEGTSLLHVAEVDARVYHYGWVRPPSLMQSKNRVFKTHFKGRARVEEMEKANSHYFDFDYGVMGKLPVFRDTHPAVMKERIDQFDWGEQLQRKGRRKKNRLPHKHEKLRYRLVSFIEKYLLFGTPVGEFRNYRKVKI